MAVVSKLENFLHVSRCEMFTFCYLLHEEKTENANKLSRVRSTDWKSPSLEITFKLIYVGGYVC